METQAGAAEVMWANPMLTIPQLSKMANKDQAWLRAQIAKGENPIPHYTDGSRKLVLWSDYVAWYTSRYAPGSVHYAENAGKKHH